MSEYKRVPIESAQGRRRDAWAATTEKNMDLQKICDDVQREWQMGGLSDGLYGDYAKEVARRAAEEEREACASVAEDTAASRDAEAIADAIRARSNA